MSLLPHDGQYASGSGGADSAETAAHSDARWQSPQRKGSTSAPEAVGLSVTAISLRTAGRSRIENSGETETRFAAAKSYQNRVISRRTDPPPADMLARWHSLANAAIPAVLLAAAFAGCGEPAAPISIEDTLYTRNRVELLAGLEPEAPVQKMLDFDTEVRILETYRSYVRVRTTEALEGWIHRPLLLDYSLRRQLRSLASQTLSLPAQGIYRARDTLNVHVEPYRWSPTFYQLTKDEEFKMLDRMLVDRLPAAAATARVLPEPTGLDHWYLVRVPRIGQSGWLIGNMAYSAIPLEIAQLAQGHAITAYFAIGETEDDSLATTKTTWLWVQAAAAYETLDFDRLMVFQWDNRRDRYVIIRQDTNLTGYLPIEILPDFESERGTGVGFRILLEKDGQLHERTYLYANRRIYRLSEEPASNVPRFEPPGGFGGRYEKVTSPGS